MGGGCCQLKRDKETEIKTGAVDEKSAASESHNDQQDVEQRLEKALDNFPFASERVKNKRNLLGRFQFEKRDDLLNLALKIEQQQDNFEVYTGFMNLKTGLREYKGLVQYGDNGIYEGHFVNGKESGKGRKIFPKLETYCGDFFEGKFDGHGKYVGIKGEYYEGSWKGGKQDGEGTELLEDGQKYTGEYKDGVKHGKGTINWQDGSYYEGSFKYGKIEGYGRKVWKSGKIYEGNWVNEKEHGYGTMTYPNQSVYEGVFANGLKHGKGKMTYSNGDVYEGQWINNKQDGEFTISGPGKKKVIAIWNDGILVSTREKTEV